MRRRAGLAGSDPATAATPISSRALLLVRRPGGWLVAEDGELRNVKVPAPPGQIVVENLVL